MEGHVILRYVGNKRVKFLDEVAVGILDAASASTPIVVVGNELKEELAVATDRIHQLEIAVAMQEGANSTLRELLREKEQELRALAEPQSVIDALTAQNGDLEAERDKAREEAQEAQETAQEADAEAWRLYRVALEIYNDLPWWKKRRRSAPVPPGEKE